MVVTRSTLGALRCSAAVLMCCCFPAFGSPRSDFSINSTVHCVAGVSCRADRTAPVPALGSSCAPQLPQGPITSPGRPVQPHCCCDLCHPLVSSQRPEQITSLPPPPIHGPPTAAHLPPDITHTTSPPHFTTTTTTTTTTLLHVQTPTLDVPARPLCRVSVTDADPGPVCSHDVRAQTASAAAARRGQAEARA